MAESLQDYFRVEARELHEHLGRDVLDLERNPSDKNLVARILRHAHTLKGAARVVQQPAVADLAHDIEEVLSPHRFDGSSVPANNFVTIFAALDKIGAEIAALERPPRVDEARAPAVSDEPLEMLRVELGEVDALLEGVFEASVQLTALRHELQGIERVRRVVGTLTEQLGTTRGTNGRAHAQVSELSVRSLAEEALAVLTRMERNAVSGLDRAETEIVQVRDAAHRLRLLPARVLFPALERVARDASKALQKQVVLVTSHGDIRLDGHVLAGLREALPHVIRNAVAHGIESPSERRAAGKDPNGKIELTIAQRGQHVAFVCRDDGRGFDVDALRLAVIRRGEVPASVAGSMDAGGLIRLALSGGLSTARTVDGVSGRGIGLDVVRETAARLKGSVDVQSEAGRGARVEILVPVSLIALAALVVRTPGGTTAIPADAVTQAFAPKEADIVQTPEGEAIALDGEVLPFLRLGEVLGQPGFLSARGRPPSAVVLATPSARVVLGVDQVIGIANIVVRPFPPMSPAEPIAMGAFLDPEGNPTIVLDPQAIVSIARDHRARPTPLAARIRPPILVIDDSLTTRMLEQSILESAGYEVDLASSAEEAIERTRVRRYGLFVVDVEMPGMDGYEFVRFTKSDAALREVPAIMVTSRGADEDRERGRAAGAYAYIVKGEFDQDRLLRTIGELIG